MKQFTSAVLLCLFIISCDSRHENQVTSGIYPAGKSVPFFKLDSLQIGCLGNVILHDIDPVSKTVLFKQTEETHEKIIFSDFDGKILTSFPKNENSSDLFGALFAPFKIIDQNLFLVYGSRGFFSFDFSGNLKSQVKFDGFHSDPISGYGMGNGMEKLGNRYLSSNYGLQNNAFRGFKSVEELKLLVFLDLEGEKKESLIQIPKTSIFQSGKFFFKNAWSPVFTISGDLIYVSFGLEPIIYVYEGSFPYSLISRHELELHDYRFFRGADRNSSHSSFFDLEFTSGKILNIKKVEQYFVVAYFPGLNEEDKETQLAEKSTDEAMVFSRRMKRKYPDRIAVLDSLGRMLVDFVPHGFDARSMVFRNNELWMLEKPDYEALGCNLKIFKVGLRVN